MKESAAPSGDEIMDAPPDQHRADHDQRDQAMVLEFPSSHRRHATSLSAERAGATGTRTIGAPMVVIEATAGPATESPG
jgi:hypothetical protein